MGRFHAAFSCFLACLTIVGSVACSNNPYPAGDSSKKILYTSFAEPPKTLDPAVSYNTNEHVFTAQIMDTLLEYHYLERPYRLIPALVEEVPHAEPLDGGRVRYRFRLRDGLSFQDDPCFVLSGGDGKGRRIVAADVAFELMRLLDPDVNSPVYQSFLLVEGFSKVHDALAERRKDASFAARRVHEQYREVGYPSGIQVPDELSLELVLSEPYPQILYWFAMQFTTPVPWEAVQYYDGKEGRPRFAEHPVGSGPFVIGEYDKRAKITLERNPNWYGAKHPEWRAPAATYPTVGEPRDVEEGNLDPSYVGRALPFIDRVEFRLDKEAIPRFGSFLQGYYDVAAVISESFEMVVQGDALSPEMQAMGAGLRKSVIPDIRYIAFNMSDKVVGLEAGERSRKLRQAMSLAVDVKEYLRIFSNGRGIPAQSPLPPGIFGHQESYRNPYRDKVDLERAKQLLTEAGYPGGIDPKTQKPLRLTFDTGNTSPSALLQYEFFVRGWRQLGLDVNVDATTYNQFQDKIRRNAYQIFLWGWIGDYPDPENFLFLLWSEASPHPNSSQYKSSAFDELFVRMKARDNDDERQRLIDQMLTILERDRPWIELFHSEEYALTHSWVKNVKPAGISLPSLKYRDIDPVQRTQKRAEWNEPVLWPMFLLFGLVVAAVVPGVLTFFKERQ